MKQNIFFARNGIFANFKKLTLRRKISIIAILAFLILGICNLSHAQDDQYSEVMDFLHKMTVKYEKSQTIEVGDLTDGGAFTSFMNDLANFAKKGMSLISGAVKGLLVSLILIDFIITASHWALSDQNRLGDLFWKFIKWGIFVWIVGNFANLADTFLQGFMVVGKAIGGGNLTILKNPSDIFNAYYAAAIKPLMNYVFHVELNFSNPIIFVKALMNFNHLPIIALCTFFACILQIILIVLIAATVVSTVAIYWFCAAIGFILFPFMMLEQTRFLSGNVISALMGGGTRMAVLTAVLGLGNGIIVNAINSFAGAGLNGDSLFMIALKVTGYIALFCWAAIKLPSAVATAISGQGGGGMGIAGGITKLATLGR